MANKRIKDISTASTSFASDDFLVTDSATSGTRKMTKDNLISQVSAGVSGDYLEESNNLSDVASTSTAMENLKIPSIGSEPNQSPLNLHLGSMAYKNFDAFYETGTWTPSVSFGGGSTGVTYNNQYGHYTKTGNMVTVQGFVYLSSKGSDNGTALINGLPYAVSAAGDAVASVVVGSAEVMTGLTSAITGRVVGSDIYLYDWGATGIATLTDANFGASALRFSATYQIA